MSFIRNAVGSIILIIINALYGFYVKQDIQSFLYGLAVIALTFILGYLAVSAPIKNKERLFLQKPEVKIRYHMFFKGAIYPGIVGELIIIAILVSGILDFSPLVRSVLQAVFFGLLYIFLNGIASLIEEYLPSNFNYYVYRASLRLATKSKDDIQNKYFISGMEYYDKYLRRKFGLTIDGIDNIFSRYVLLEKGERITLITSLLNTEKDSLADFRVLNKWVSFNGNILTKVSNVQKLKDYGTVIVPIITIVFSFIQLVLNLK